MNRNQIKGILAQLKGRAKQVAGRIVGNKTLELKGGVQKTGGKVEKGYGDVKEDLKDSS